MTILFHLIFSSKNTSEAFFCYILLFQSNSFVYITPTPSLPRHKKRGHIATQISHPTSTMGMHLMDQMLPFLATMGIFWMNIQFYPIFMFEPSLALMGQFLCHILQIIPTFHAWTISVALMYQKLQFWPPGDPFLVFFMPDTRWACNSTHFKFLKPSLMDKQLQFGPPGGPQSCNMSQISWI